MRPAGRFRFVSLNDTVSVRSVPVETGMSKGLASLYLTILVNYGLLSRTGRAFHRRKTDLWSGVLLLLNLPLLHPVFPGRSHMVTDPGPYDEETGDDHVGKYSCGDEDPDDQDFIYMGSCQRREMSARVPTVVLLSEKEQGPDLVTAEGDIVHLAVGIVALEGGTSSRCFRWGKVMHYSMSNEG